jgi:hypothetical protein
LIFPEKKGNKRKENPRELGGRRRQCKNGSYMI